MINAISGKASSTPVPPSEANKTMAKKAIPANEMKEVESVFLE